jgi:hypothetical protein
MQPSTQPVVIEGAIERANHLILNSLKAGRRNAREILAAAEGAKISVRSIQRAATALGVVKTKDGFDGGWTWRLPAAADDTAKAPTEQVVPTMLKDTMVLPGASTVPEGSIRLNHVNVAPRVAPTESVKDREIPETSRAETMATRLRNLEARRGAKAPIYGLDPRVIRWAQAGISDPDLKEAYERAVFDMERKGSQGPLTAGILDPYIWKQD